MRSRRWQDLTSRQRAGLLAVGLLQWCLAAVAWKDLASRPASAVNGSRARWAAIIAINWVGPLAWFRWGRRPGHGSARR